MVAGCITAQSQHPVLGHDFSSRRQMTLHETTLEGDSTESALLDTPIASNSPISASTAALVSTIVVRMPTQRMDV